MYKYFLYIYIFFNYYALTKYKTPVGKENRQVQKIKMNNASVILFKTKPLTVDCRAMTAGSPPHTTLYSM